jgi:hypothetical protein
LLLPPRWQLRDLQGIDSYVGEIIGPYTRLIFDYGLYTGPFSSENYPDHIITEEDIGGLSAQLIRPATGSPGITGVHIIGMDERSGLGFPRSIDLRIEGEDLTLEEQEIVFGIFRTIRPGEPRRLPS